MTVDPDSAPFWEGVAGGAVRVPRCRACERRHFPPTPACPFCGAGELAWDEVEPRGTVYSCVTVHREVAGPARWPLPYTIAVVELEAGPRVLGVVAGGGRVDIGDAVEVIPRGGEPVGHLEVRGVAP